MLSIFGIGALASLLLAKNNVRSHIVGSIFAIIGSVVGIFLALVMLITHSFFSMMIPTSFPLFMISFHADALSAFFILIITTVSLASSLYGIAYMRHYYKAYNVGFFGFFYNLFILSLLLVTTAYNGFYFIFVWELMSLTSFFLVIFECKLQKNIVAGYVYFAMTHVASAFILVAFYLLYLTTGSFDFQTIQQKSVMIPAIIKNSVYVLLLVGYGTKAGIIPFHIWLPRAHSATPSHVSALMSGVMIKMGIFMLLRFYVDILAQPPLWLGIVILTIGSFSAVLGVLYALAEHDIKRLLAYHSIENIGIILIGFGAGLIFISLGNISLAALALMAALFHTFNHAIFKALLFLGAGSVISQTQTNNIEKYGGLIKKMPYTAFFFLIGSMAIVGLPPFNGFVSEWLTFQSLFGGVVYPSMFFKSLFIFAGGGLALTGGLAAACFVKAFGLTFLARARSQEAEKAKDPSRFMLISMGYLALLCLLLGVFSFVILPIIRTVVLQIAHLGTVSYGFNVNQTLIQVNNGFGVISMPFLLLALIIVVVVTMVLVDWISNKQKVRIGELWTCGYHTLTPRMEITATGFSRSLIIMFKNIFQSSSQYEIEYVDKETHYFAKSKTVTLHIKNLYEDYLYRPVDHLVYTVSLQVTKFQTGNISLYISYIIIVLIGLLMWSRYY
jgi:hydrogenase-4 component B